MALDEMIGEKMQLTQNEETGFIKCDFENSIPQDKTVFLMDFMVFSLQSIEKHSTGKSIYKLNSRRCRPC